MRMARFFPDEHRTPRNSRGEVGPKRSVVHPQEVEADRVDADERPGHRHQRERTRCRAARRPIPVATTSKATPRPMNCERRRGSRLETAQLFRRDRSRLRRGPARGLPAVAGRRVCRAPARSRVRCRARRGSCDQSGRVTGPRARAALRSRRCRRQAARGDAKTAAPRQFLDRARQRSGREDPEEREGIANPSWALCRGY